MTSVNLPGRNPVLSLEPLSYLMRSTFMAGMIKTLLFFIDMADIKISI